jgi:hypothetical protein
MNLGIALINESRYLGGCDGFWLGRGLYN